MGRMKVALLDYLMVGQKVQTKAEMRVELKVQ